MNLDQWFAKYSNGKTLINRGGVQCVAVANAFEAEFVQGQGDEWIGTPLTGWANDWWNNFARDNDYNEYIKVSAAEKAQKGDVAIWHKYKNNGLPHIAVVYEEKNGGIVCLTQNPGNAHLESLSKVGLAGYLRPKKLIQSAAVNKKSDEAIAKEVLAGAWGNNPERKKRLEAAGYNYDAIQGKVNSIATTPATQAAPAAAPAPAPAPAPAGFRVGQTVASNAKQTKDYNGAPIQAWHDRYTITELIGDRAVLSVGSTVWAALRTSDIHAA